MKKILKISLFLLLLIPFLNVSASSLMDYNAVGYGFHYSTTDHQSVAYQWLGYNTNYLQRDMSDFPSNVSSSGILVEDIGIRFRIDGGFKKGHNYVITFEWTNYNSMYGNYSWYDVYVEMQKTWTCRESSWSSTSIAERSCFDAGNYSEKQKLTDNSILITIHFTASIDMYGMTIYWFYPSSATNHAYYSQGWSIGPVSYEDISDSSQAIIDNATQNTQNIINNQNTNTQNIINNQNQNTQAIIDSNKSCTNYSLDSAILDGKMLNSSGSIVSNNNYAITDYINVNNSTIYNTTLGGSGYGGYYCFYNSSKINLSCFNISDLSANAEISMPASAYYIRISISKTYNYPVFKVCKNGSQAVVDAITDSNISDASSDADNFFSGFTTNTYGLSSIITAPLTLIQSITSSTCTPLVLPLPFVNQNLTLPCMSQVYSQNFGSFLTIYQTITYGIIAYWVVVRIFNLVKDFKNPDHDEIEVMEL